jgi:hypothetical protein
MASAMAPLPVPRSSTEHVPLRGSSCQGEFDQEFGFRPRHQHGGRDASGSDQNSRVPVR